MNNQRYIFYVLILLHTSCASQTGFWNNRYYGDSSGSAYEGGIVRDIEPTTEEIAALSYGKKPKNHERIFKKVVLENLKDPDSAQFRKIKQPRKFWGKNSDIINSWLICGEVNAKNGFGGFSGFEIMAIQYFADGTLDILTLNDGRTNFTFSSESYPCSN